MADGDQPVRDRVKMHNQLTKKATAGGLVLLFLALLAGGALTALGLEAGRNGFDFAAHFDRYLWQLVRFTLLQAGLSSLFSVLFAIPLARALYVQADFPGRSLMLRFFALPLALPALVTILGIISIYGNNGLFAYLSQIVGQPLQPNIYGLVGILIAHVFFNMPLAVRIILCAYDTIPPDYWKLSAQLGQGAFACFRFIEWPVIRRHLPEISGFIFMLCVTSFTTVLTLGGGPWATTLEVAIYQSLHFDFDPVRAAILTFTQLGLTLLVLTILRLGGKSAEEGFSHVLMPKRYNKASRSVQLVNIAIILAGFLYIVLPIAGMVISGMAADWARLLREPVVWQATITSMGLGFCAATLACLMALTLAAAKEGKKRAASNIFDSGASLILVMPPIVIGAGWFILLRHFTDPFAAAPFMVVSVNAAMAMPLVLRLLRPAWDMAASRHNRLCTQLGLHGVKRFWLIDWPAIVKPFGMGFAFAMVLSLGDLGTIALFGNGALQTLPYLLLQRMGSYRSLDAAGLALVLSILCLSVLGVASRIFGREKDPA